MWREKRRRCCCCVFEWLQSSALFFHLTRIFSSNVLFFSKSPGYSTLAQIQNNNPFLWRTSRQQMRKCSMIFFFWSSTSRGERRSVRELAATECTSSGVSSETNPLNWKGKLPDRIGVKRHSKRVLSRWGSPTKNLNIFKQIVQWNKDVENISYVAFLWRNKNSD